MTTMSQIEEAVSRLGALDSRTPDTIGKDPALPDRLPGRPDVRSDRGLGAPLHSGRGRRGRIQRGQRLAVIF